MKTNPFYLYKKLLEDNLKPGSIRFIYNNWKDKNRYWHNIDHLEDIISHIERWRYRFSKEEFDQLILAAFFHDAIYDPKDPDNNEENSLDLLKKSYSGDTKLDLAEKAIMCTKSRKRPLDFPCKIFWEADNSIFKKTWKDYLDWEKKIRKEYYFVPDDIYKKARIKFLEQNICVFGPRSDTYIKKLIKILEDK